MKQDATQLHVSQCLWIIVQYNQLRSIQYYGDGECVNEI